MYFYRKCVYLYSCLVFSVFLLFTWQCRARLFVVIMCLFCAYVFSFWRFACLVGKRATCVSTLRVCVLYRSLCGESVMCECSMCACVCVILLYGLFMLFLAYVVLLLVGVFVTCVSRTDVDFVGLCMCVTIFWALSLLLPVCS